MLVLFVQRSNTSLGFDLINLAHSHFAAAKDRVMLEMVKATVRGYKQIFACKTLASKGIAANGEAAVCHHLERKRERFKCM